MNKKILFLLLPILIGFQLPIFSQEIPSCYQTLATKFFKYEITSQAFSMNRIDQSLWDSLVTQLNQQAQNVPQLIKTEAQKLRPNPLNSPFNPEVASQLLYNTLYIIFKQVIVENYITVFTNEVAIGSMFKYIWMQQLQSIEACLGKAAVQKYILTQ